MRDGSYFEGEFKDGEINGKGYKYNRWNGSEFTGDFLNGQLNGKGTMMTRNQMRYEGEFSDNQRHGYGELKSSRTNEYFKGQWYHDKRHGQGEQRYSDGSIYVGDWVHDRRQGHGEIKFLDASSYDVSEICLKNFSTLKINSKFWYLLQGQWRNDMFNGLGLYTSAIGYVYEGTFENNKPQKPATRLAVTVNTREIEEAFTAFNVEVKALTNENKVFPGILFLFNFQFLQT